MIMEGIEMFDFIFHIIESEKFYLPIFYIAIGMFIYSIIARMITSINKIDIKHSKGIDKRKNTVVTLFKNIIKYVIAVIVIILILDIYGVNTTSLIASLGVATAIIGLAFQDTIKDFLAGVFLVFDNAYAVGDWIKVNDFTGEVISLGLKTTKVRAYTGEIKIFSNSSFSEVINYSFEHSKILVYLPVHYETSMEKLEKVLLEIKAVVEKEKDIYSMELLGIDEFGDSSINYAIVVECVPMTHIGAKRKVLGLIKKKFDEEGIVIPYNQIDVHIDK